MLTTSMHASFTFSSLPAGINGPSKALSLAALYPFHVTHFQYGDNAVLT